MNNAINQFSAFLSLAASAALGSEEGDCYRQTDLQFDYEDRYGMVLDDRSCLECGEEHSGQCDPIAVWVLANGATECPVYRNRMINEFDEGYSVLIKD